MSKKPTYYTNQLGNYLYLRQHTQITHEVECFLSLQFRKPTKAVYHHVLLIPSFQSNSHGAEMEPRSPSYTHYREVLSKSCPKINFWYFIELLSHKGNTLIK